MHAEASRYNFDAEFNGHYMVRMDKMHIVMIDGVPLFMIPTDGNTGDNEPVEELFSMLGDQLAEAGLGKDDIKVMGDGGYNSFATFDSVHRHTGQILNCPLASNSVFHEEATWERLQAKYSSMYCLQGFDAYRKNDKNFVLAFLRRHGEGELVGKHLRNMEMERMEAQEAEGKKDTDREVCEVVHHSMKSWLDFTTKKIRHATRHATLRCRFFIAQLLGTIFKGYVDID